MPDQNEDIPSQFRQLGRSLWREAFKSAGAPPVVDAEQKFLRGFWAQRIPILRAALVTVATVIVLKFGLPSAIWISDLWERAYSHIEPQWAWWTFASLLLVAFSSRWLDSAVSCFIHWLKRTRFFPVAVGICVVSMYLAPNKGGDEGWFYLFTAGLFLLLVVALRDKTTPLVPTDDNLHREYVVDRLMEHFLLPRAEGTRRIALLGTWGSGKTTVLRLLQHRISFSDTAKGLCSALVNPWTAKDANDARRMLAIGFEEALQSPVSLGRSLLDHPIWSWFSGFKTGTGFGLTLDLSRLFQGNTSSAEQILVQRINQRIRDRRRTPVILVDDMERAEPDVIRTMFPLIARLGDIEGCFFVFALDPNRIAKAFGESGWGEGDEAKGYIDKVFDLQISLPEPRTRDIVRMCLSSVNVAVTPKLSDALEQIGNFLPVNPRAAVHFLNDAKAKEFLFLGRYGPKEHDYGGFFLLRMLELEHPGFAEVTKLNCVREWREHLFYREFSGDRDPVKLAMLSDTAWVEAVARVPTLKNTQSRVREAFTYICSRNLDFRWATQDYMRLITLSKFEREQLKGRWKEQASKVSIETMLTSLFPGKKFSDVDEDFRELIREEVESYEGCLKSALQTDNSVVATQRARDAVLIGERMLSHLQFATKTNLTTDLALFDDSFFEKWIATVAWSQIRRCDADVLRNLEEFEFSFCLAISEQITNVLRGQFARRPVEQYIIEMGFDAERAGLKERLQKIRMTLFAQFHDEVRRKMRDGECLTDGFRKEFGVGSVYTFFSEPSNWLWMEGGEWRGMLEALSIEAKDSVHMQTLCAHIAHTLYIHPISCAVCGKNHVAERRRFEKLAQDFPEYMRFFWDAAMLLPEDDNERYRLMRDRRGALQADEGRSFVPPALIEACFPVQ
jgi:hypothetical protein